MPEVESEFVGRAGATRQLPASVLASDNWHGWRRRIRSEVSRVLVAGEVLRPGWVGGEPQTAHQVEEGLRKLGHSVETVYLERHGVSLVSLISSPFDWDQVAVGFYGRVLDRTRPEIVFGFYDHDSSLCRATVRAGIPFVECVHIHWPVCPTGVLYIDGQGVCSGPTFSKCLRHMSTSIPDAHLPLHLRELPAPLGIQAYSKLSSRKTELAHADRVVVPSESMSRLLSRFGYSNIRVVPSGIDLGEWPFHEYSPVHPPEVLLPAASASERKGLGQFRAASGQLRDSGYAVRFAATNFSGDSLVEGTGFLTHAELLAKMSRASVIVVPTLWDEPFGLVYLEAMAVGRPVVCYDAGAAPELVTNNETGVVVPRGNSTALAGAIRERLDDPAGSREMGLRGRRRVESFYSVDQMVLRYESVLRELIG